MINTGTVIFPYRIAHIPVSMESEPYIFTGTQMVGHAYTSVEQVNAQRLELELQQGLNVVLRIKSLMPAEVPILLLFDGSLIFWHLDNKQKQDAFFARYCALLEQLYQNNIWCAWYISMPKNKDLLHIIKLSLCNFDTTNTASYQIIEHYSDATIMQFHLPPYAQSTIFSHRGLLYEEYPGYCRPHFIYMNVGNEIARIEFPAWIAQDQTTCSMMIQLIVDQCIKGQGYPIALAEAHEQAVIKGPDRDFFYSMLDQIGMRYNQRPMQSQKSFRKKYKLF
jgi:hypothetical protein